MKPREERVGTKYRLIWDEANIRATIFKVKEHSDGRILAEVKFETTRENIPPHIQHTQLNLLSSQSKKSLAKELEEIYPIGNWYIIIEQLSVKTVELYRKGEPVIELTNSIENLNEPSYLIEPFIYEKQPNLLYGEGGTCKSYLALFFALICQEGLQEVPGASLKAKKANVLYLDYESTREEMERRLVLLSRGLGIPDARIKYRECRLPLIDEIDVIEEIVLENRIDFVIIDSIGVAAGGGSLNEAQTATEFYSALRRLGATSLLISHIAKDSDKKPSPFGSVYWRNLTRNEWYIRRSSNEDEDRILLGLFHQKNNLGKLMPPRGFAFDFNGDEIVITEQDIRNIDEFIEHLSLKDKIVKLLKSEGKLGIKEIAEALEVSQTHIRVVLNRYKGKLFVKMGDKWGLLVQG